MMKKPPRFIVVRAKSRGLEVVSTSTSKNQAERAVNGLLVSGVPVDDLAVYEAQPIHVATVTTLTWGARRGRPPGSTMASKKPAKKVKRPAKPKKTKKTRSSETQVPAQTPEAPQVPQALRRRGRPPKVALAPAGTTDGGNGASI